MKEYIYGRNAVLEALRSGDRVNRIVIADGVKPAGVQDILDLADTKGVQVEKTKADKLDQLTAGARNQGVVAFVKPLEFSTLEDVFARAEERNEAPFLLILDELQDPQNVGAIIRTADAAGVHGVLMPKRHSCPLTGTVAKISAGAVEYVPLVQIGNIVQTIEMLQKEYNCWVVGADMDGKTYTRADLKGAIALVIGAEGKGIGRLVKEHCDELVSLPMLGGVNSLNASNAAAVLMYEIVRQREVDN